MHTIRMHSQIHLNIHTEKINKNTTTTPKNPTMHLSSKIPRTKWPDLPVSLAWIYQTAFNGSLVQFMHPTLFSCRHFGLFQSLVDVGSSSELVYSKVLQANWGKSSFTNFDYRSSKTIALFQQNCLRIRSIAVCISNAKQLICSSELLEASKIVYNYTSFIIILSYTSMYYIGNYANNFMV